jgi:zinc protease
MNNFFKSVSITAIVVSGILITPVISFAKAPTSIAAMTEKIDISYEKFKLENGLTVLVHSDHTIPTVFVGMFYGVGSKDEPEGKFGFAHLFEHLMFKGTENYNDEYFKPFINAGATGMNGTTDTDQTRYYATVPSGALDMALWMESDRMSHLLGAITQESLDEERSVVKNEKRNGMSKPGAKGMDRLREGMYPKEHPYHHSVIGPMKDLDNASLKDVHGWFKKYYGASNAVLMLSGDVTLEEAQKKAAKYFNDAPVGDPLAKKLRWVPEISENRIEMMYDNTVSNVNISRNWFLPPGNERDTILMELVTITLAGDTGSPLPSRLMELGLAIDASAWASGSTLAGEVNVEVNLNIDATTEEVQGVLDEVIANYIKEGPDKERLENAKLSWNVELIGSMASNAVVGFMLSRDQLLYNDPDLYKKKLTWVNEATVDDLRRVAKKWLSKPYFQLTTSPFEPINSVAKGADRSKIPPIADPTGIKFPKVEVATLENGIKLVFAKYGLIPFVNVNIQFETGIIAEKEDEFGAANMAFSMMPNGTKKYSEDELSMKMGEIATNISANSGLRTSGMNFRVLMPFMEKSFELASEMLQRPTYPIDRFEEQQSEQLLELVDSQKTPAGSAGSYFNKALYGDKSLSGVIPTEKMLSELSREEVIDFYKREVTPNKMTVYMAGNIDFKVAKALVQKTFSKWKRKSSNLRPVKIDKALKKRPRVILVDQPGAVESTIIAGHALPAYNGKDSETLYLLNGVFGGGFTARLNMNIREDKGWSYGIYSNIISDPLDDRSIMVSGAVQTDKTKESMVEIMKEYKEITSNRPVTAEEFDGVVQKEIRSLPSQFSDGSSFIYSMISSAEYGKPYNDAEGIVNRIRAVTLDDVNAKAQALIDPKNLIWVIVGDLYVIEKDIRSLGYGDVEVWDSAGKKIR